MKVQVLEGKPYVKEKNKLGEGAVCFDIGPSTIATVSVNKNSEDKATPKFSAKLEQFCSGLDTKQKEIATWKGSPHTASMVASQIQERWGVEEVKKYDPMTNCFTFNAWHAKGFKVKKGEKALKSVTFVDASKDADEREKLVPRNVSLFYYLQVEPIKPV